MLWRKVFEGNPRGDNRRVTWRAAESYHNSSVAASDGNTAADVLAEGVASMAAPGGGSEAAVAAALGGGPGADDDDDADAVAASQEDLARVVVNQPFKLNNLALKWIRDSHEDPPGNPITDRVDLTHSDPLGIGVIERDGGMSYRFKEGETEPWSWRQMLAAMSPEAKKLISGADHALSVVRITCEPVPESYDHKRWHAAVPLGRPYGAGVRVRVGGLSCYSQRWRHGQIPHRFQ